MKKRENSSREKVVKINDYVREKATGVKITVNTSNATKEQFEGLENILSGNRGTLPTEVILESDKGRASMPLGGNYLVSPNPKMITAINRVFDRNCVKLIIQ